MKTKLFLSLLFCAGLALAQSAGSVSVVGTATSNGITASSTVTFSIIAPPVVLTCTAPSIAGIGPVIWSGIVIPCTAALNSPAPTGGTIVQLASTVNATTIPLVLSLPPSVTIAAGATNGPVTIAAK